MTSSSAGTRSVSTSAGSPLATSELAKNRRAAVTPLRAQTYTSITCPRSSTARYT